jgi:hypothetical protein
MGANGRRLRDRRFIHTRREDETGVWYALDNAASIMPAVTNEIITSLFRFEAELDEPVDVETVKGALELTVQRMPYFNVTLRRGLFWYYFEPCGSLPPVYPDSPSPCQQWDIHRHGTRMFRVRCDQNRIAAEFSHAMTDGTGGMSFFKTLLANYFTLKGIDPGVPLGEGEWCDILVPTSRRIPPEEFEDAYQRYFPKGLPFPEKSPKAFHFRSKSLPKGQYRVISGVLSTAEVLAEAKRRHVSLTELLVAIYLDALLQMWHATKPLPRAPFVTVEVPINLRTLFPSRTFRNFSLFVLVGEDMRLGMRSFEELVQRTHYQMKLEYDRMSIAKHLSRNAGSARNLAVRMVPLWIKDVFARMLFIKFGECMLSGFISNLGQIAMPPGFAPHIRTFGFIPAPSLTTMTNASVMSWNDTLFIDFGSLAQSRDLERLFFRRLRSLGLHVRVSCRLEEETHAILP